MSNEIQTVENGAISQNAIFNDDALFARMEKMAQIMASGKSYVPSHFRNSPGDCMAVVMQAAQWKMSPFAVAQKTFLINGVIGYEAQLVNAVINASPAVSDRMNYEWFGDWENVLGKFESRKNEKNKIYHVPGWNPNDEQGLGVRVWATLKNEDNPRYLELLLVQAQVRNSTLWASDPKQQLAYLAVKRWARLHCSDVILGVYTPDELAEREPIDMGAIERAPEPRIETTEKQSTVSGAKKKARQHSEQRKSNTKKQPALEPEKTAQEGANAEAVTLESVTKDISWADTQQDLKKVGAKAENLSPEDQEEARRLYSIRASEIKDEMKKQASVESINTETGEITG